MGYLTWKTEVCFMVQFPLLPQPNQQSKTTQNNFGWGGIIISKKTRIASATWHHSLRNMAS